MNNSSKWWHPAWDLEWGRTLWDKNFLGLAEKKKFHLFRKRNSISCSHVFYFYYFFIRVQIVNDFVERYESNIPVLSVVHNFWNLLNFIPRPNKCARMSNLHFFKPNICFKIVLKLQFSNWSYFFRSSLPNHEEDKEMTGTLIWMVNVLHFYNFLVYYSQGLWDILDKYQVRGIPQKDKETTGNQALQHE